MQAKKIFVMSTVLCLVAACGAAHAQSTQRSATAEEQARLPMPQVELPAKPFKTAEEHYKYLLEKAHGGTKHTMSTIPVCRAGSGSRT